MLKVKHLTLFKPKKWKKGWNFDQGCKKKILVKIKLKRDTGLQKKSSKARFCLQPSIAFSLILTKKKFSIECAWF